MRPIIVAISLLTAIAFLAISAASSWQIFTQVLASGEEIRTELWVLIIMCFLGGVIMIGIAWAIVEVNEARRDHLASRTAPANGHNEEDE